MPQPLQRRPNAMKDLDWTLNRSYVGTPFEVRCAYVPNPAMISCAIAYKRNIANPGLYCTSGKRMSL